MWCGSAATAHAMDEDEWQLAAGGGFTHLHSDGRAGGGFGLTLEGQRGLSDVWALRAALGASWNGMPAAGVRPAGDARSVHAAAGVSCAYDVLRLVPFLELGVVLADTRGAGIRDAHGAVGFESGAGGEYLLDRRWTVALVARARYLPVVFGAVDVDVGRVWSLSFGLRLGRTFE